MTRRVWFFVVPVLALLALAARSTGFRWSPVPSAVAPVATLHIVGRTAATPHVVLPPSATDRPPPTGPERALTPDDEDDHDVEARARVIASPLFSRLPPSDQHWVLVQARARVQDPDDPRLEQIVHELSEVRLFAVSEREEPLAPLDSSR